MHTFDLSLGEITKVEGAASLDLSVKDNKVTSVKFKIDEHKRFYTQAMRGKMVMALPQLLARICGTCSNAHLLCSIESCENALGIEVSQQTNILRDLTMDGLMIRDHALHLYLFSMPDIFGKDNFLSFDEDDETEHQMLHDAFEIKAVGDGLAKLVSGRSVHAMFPTIGGFNNEVKKEDIAPIMEKLKKTRPAVLRLMEVFAEADFHLDRETQFMAIVGDNEFNYLRGKLKTSDGMEKDEKEFRDHLEHVVLPYSQASGYKYKGTSFMVGSMARINLAKELLEDETKKDAKKYLDMFPTTDIFQNNLAQAIEILNSIDHAIKVFATTEFKKEDLIKAEPPKEETVGIGVIEAPRGTLYHKIVLQPDNKVKEGEIIVPTGQNQINIEQDIKTLVEKNLDKLDKDGMAMEIEKLIRAYDPCMSCGSHFLKVNWNEEKI
ncbi:MAG: nickel-dependent hydrogenase large subunit [bacterium]